MNKDRGFAILCAFALMGGVLAQALLTTRSAFAQAVPNGPTGVSGTNSGDVTIGTANGLSLSGQAISLAAAGSSAAGAVTTGTQTFAGAKTFSTSIASPMATLTGSSTRVLSVPQNSCANWGGVAVGSACGNGIDEFYDGTYWGVHNGSVNRFDVHMTTGDAYAGIGNFVAAKGLQLNNSLYAGEGWAGAEPTCNSTSRGTLWYTPGASTVADKTLACVKSTADTYSWQPVAPAIESLSGYLGLSAEETPLLATAAVHTGMGTTLRFTVDAAGVAGAGSAVLEILDGATQRCTLTFACNDAAGTIEAGACTGVRTAGNNIIAQWDSTSDCTSLPLGNVSAPWQ